MIKESKEIKIQLKNVSALYNQHLAVVDVNANIYANMVTAIIGPSGCGKSTLLRTLNRMHETIKGASVSGSVLIDGEDIYKKSIDPVDVRRRIGMVFQRPNPFPTLSIYENVVAGYLLAGEKKGKNFDEIVEMTLKQVALWDEVKDKLKKPGTSLSGGQQQRLCIARTVAIQPEIILMDEPCSALDPIATLKIEDLIHDLKEKYTIVMVTHNMQQAGRVSENTMFMLSEGGSNGKLIEYNSTKEMFTKPVDRRTEDYITGKFG